MMATKTVLPMRFVLCGLVAAMFSACVAIPVQKQTFQSEFKAEIQPTDEPPAKEYAASVAVSPVRGSCVDIGLLGEITTTQPMVQHYNSVSVTKRKRLAIGFYTDWAEEFYHPKDALVPVYWPYLGNGRYSTDTFGYELPGAFTGGILLNGLSLGLLPLPFEFLGGFFGPFEHGHHYLGKVVETKVEPYPGNPNFTKINKTHDSSDLELLAKFSPEERRRIGAWTYLDDDAHPQNTFWFGFTACPRQYLPWPGVSKYCTYVVHEPVKSERTTLVEPKVTKASRAIIGPYGVFLRIPDVDYTRMLTVPRGEAAVAFDFADVIGKTSGEAYVRFLPPSGGLEEAWDDDSRVLLEQVQGRDFPVDLGLPLPRLSEGPP